jgi:hypothetical protein
MYSSAIADVDAAGAMIDKASGDLGALDTIGDEIKDEWESFKTDFEGVQGDLVGGAREAITNRGELRKSFMDQLESDEEGAAGRAMADVSGAAERGRQAESMRLSGLGIDPTSGRSRSMMRESRNQEALSGTIAGNVARRGEKDRVAGLTATGLQLMDPSADIGAATQIQNLSQNLLTQRSNMAVTKAGLQTDLAGSRANLSQARGNLAEGVSRIGEQYGDYGGAQKGIQYANTATDEGEGAPRTSLRDRLFPNWKP